ncbi:unnamed protein product [Periconia digitata]|uniref:Exocyst complex component Sec3 PIP2-binding N-terminal domain-containing protein n=1 Tax=Periconia digitata TaxID=1303443 RepID=A0A9W4U846_9PLEO|nr:unnamed protein product [Periconia digitata]
MDGNPRPRNYPSGGSRPSGESRRPPGAPGGPPSSTSSRSTMSRAERFEDERRRITASCFSKVDADGSLHESYITHIRIQEDGAYPQTPPPPGGNPRDKKPRVIIITVKNTSRVSLHKARENANGTFSVGKTWHMADLSYIENFVHLVPKNDEEAQYKQWAGEVGFTVTVNKPYYWEASTAKEKEFFIGSLVKIYTKYTDKFQLQQGKFPVLSGFSATELIDLTDGRPYAATEEGRAAHDAWTQRYSTSKPPPDDQDPYVMLQRAAEGRSRNELRPPQPAGMPSPNDSRRPPGADPRRPPPLDNRNLPPPRGPGRPATSEGAPQDNRNLPPPRGPGRPPTAEGSQRERMQRPAGPPSMPNMRDPNAVPRGRPSEEGRPPPSPRSGGFNSGTPPPPGFRNGSRPPPPNEPNLRNRPSRENMALRPSPSRERLAPSSSSTPPPPIPSPSSQRLMSPNSRPDLRPKTPEGSGLPSVLAAGRPPVPDDARSQRSQKSPAPPSKDGHGLGLGRVSGEERRPNGYPSPARREPSPARGYRNEPPLTDPAISRADDSYSEEKAVLPERRRPPIESKPSQGSQFSVANGPPSEFVTPSQTPPPPMAPPPRRRPQEIPERSKPGSLDESSARKDPGQRMLNDNSMLPSQPTPPPTSPLPRPPPASPLPHVPKSQEPKAPEIPEAASMEPKPLTPKPLEPRAFEPGPLQPRPLTPRTKTPASKTPELDRIETKFPERKPAGSREQESKISEVKMPEPEAPAPAPKAPSPVAEKPPPLLAASRSPPAVENSEKKQPPAEVSPLKVQPPKEDQPEQKPDTASPVTPITPSEDASKEKGMASLVKSKLSKPTAAEQLRKAVKAAGAFKPRAGGGAEKFFAKDTKNSDEPDGINAVFVPQRQPAKEEEKKAEEESKPKPKPEQSSSERPSVDTGVVPALKVSSPLSPPTGSSAAIDERTRSPSPTPEKPVTKAEPEAEVRRKKRRSNQQVMNISKLGIDPGILDGRGLEFEILLAEFGWGSSELSHKNIESLESEIKREIARVEAGSWLSHLEQKDDRVETVERMLDRAIAECDELEGLLTLYNVELGSLNDDIAFIEAQSQGLQVQTANQRLLQNELKQLVDTISITPDQLEPLRRAPIGKVNGLEAIESSLVLLYKALLTIDPSFIESRKGDATRTVAASSGGVGNSELAAMQALQEKKDRYLAESAMFLDRLKKHMDITFGAAFLQTRDTLANLDRKAMPSTKANIEAHDAGRNMLWMISPLILFAKEIDQTSWESLLRMYQGQAGIIYQEEIRDNIGSWKRFARKPTGDEQDLLFTAQEKEPESITGAARKLTVKRSQTLARGLRVASSDKEPKTNSVQSGKLFAFDVFSKALDDIGPVLLTEQNFITEFFHATSTDSADFPEAVNAAPPDLRRGPNLWVRKQFEADRAMAKRVAEVMEDIFAFWPSEIQSLVEWAIKADPLQGIGILYAVDRKLHEIEDSNQDFLTRNLQKVHERLTGLFVRFVDEQIRAIEDTKVKIKKRKGVISFIKTFPHFAVAIENMLPASEETNALEIRRMVDDAYKKINKAMFESLKVIAKESPAVMATQGQGDPEDKEALNYHILLIENMNHYIEEVDGRSDSALLEWKNKAQDEMKEHMGLYVDAVIRRPLSKLLDFIESTETLLNQPGGRAAAISQRSSHSRAVYKKLMNSYDAREIRKGIESLKKRVDKHFGDADDPSISRDLVFKVLKECEKRYTDVHDRIVRVNQDVYSGEVESDWGASEVTAAFRR